MHSLLYLKAQRYTLFKEETRYHTTPWSMFSLHISGGTYAQKQIHHLTENTHTPHPWSNTLPGHTQTISLTECNLLPWHPAPRWPVSVVTEQPHTTSLLQPPTQRRASPHRLQQCLPAFVHHSLQKKTPLILLSYCEAPSPAVIKEKRDSPWFPPTVQDRRQVERAEAAVAEESPW